MRSAGILLPISSLPSPYGIGTFSKEAREVVDLLVLAGQHYWQILPLGQTGYGDSPYQAFSATAGNPYFIDLDTLLEKGLLLPEELSGVDFGQDHPERVDYEKLYRNRWRILRTAFSRAGDFESDPRFQEIYARNTDWLDDYALFCSIKGFQGGRSWHEWEEGLRIREKSALEAFSREHAEEIRFYKFLQYEFCLEWTDLKKYANSKGIEIIGDLPIYVASDSADAWSHPELFQFDADERMISVAGCPPDAFSATGQLWGNPLYDWPEHERSGFAWWKKRMEHALTLYDVARIDHFRGFESYYSIPAGDKDASRGHWETGPGMRLFEALRENPNVTSRSIIAEDLGFLTDSVRQLVEDSGFPGMKLIEFAFDSRDAGDYFPFRYTTNTVVYTGTHDNQTLDAWYDELSEGDRKLADDYLGLHGLSREEKCWAFIRLALSSVSDTCVIPMQDYLCLGAWARMNKPSTLGGNWCWRMREGEFTEALAAKILRLTEIYGRIPSA